MSSLSDSSMFGYMLEEKRWKDEAYKGPIMLGLGKVCDVVLISESGEVLWWMGVFGVLPPHVGIFFFMSSICHAREIFLCFGVVN